MNLLHLLEVKLLHGDTGCLPNVLVCGHNGGGDITPWGTMGNALPMS